MIARLNAAIVAELKEPSVVERIRALGAEPMPQTPEEFSAFILREIDKWTKVVAAPAGCRSDRCGHLRPGKLESDFICSRYAVTPSAIFSQSTTPSSGSPAR